MPANTAMPSVRRISAPIKSEKWKDRAYTPRGLLSDSVDAIGLFAAFMILFALGAAFAGVDPIAVMSLGARKCGGRFPGLVGLMV